MFLSPRASLEGSYDTGGRGPIDDFWYGPIPAKLTGGVRVNDDTAMRLALVYACTIVISQDQAKIPLLMYRRKDDGSRELVTDHPILKVLRQPQPMMNGVVYRERMQAHLLLRGNGYSVIQDGARGQISGLKPLRPDRMRVEAMADGTARYHYIDPLTGKETTYLWGEIFHLRGLSLEGPCGLSPIDQQKESLGEAFAAQQYASAFFANDARPGVILKHPSHFKDEGVRKNWLDAFKRQFGGTSRFGAMILEYGFDIKDLPAIDHAALQFIELRKMKANEICAMYRVPPHKVGILERSTNNNIEHQGIEYVTDCLLTWCRRWEEALEEQLLSDSERDEFYFQFNLDSLMRGDMLSRFQAYESAIAKGGWMIRNEARRKEGMRELPELDTPLMPVNTFEVGEPRPGAAAAPGAAQEPDDDETSAAPASDPNIPPDDAQDDQARARELELQARRRVLVRETRALSREWERSKGDPAAFAEALTSFYAWHLPFVSQALVIDLARAEAYCMAQVAEVQRAIEQKAVTAMLAAWDADAEAMQFSPIPRATPKEK